MMSATTAKGVRRKTPDAVTTALALLRTRKAAAVVAAVAVVGSGYLIYRDQQQQKQKRSRPGNASSRTVVGKGARGSRRSPAKSLNKLIRYLLPLVGRKIGVLVCLAILRTAMSNRLARLQGHLFRAAFLRRVPLFVRNIAENLLLCFVASCIESTTKRFASMIELTWRKHLTNRIHNKYFNNMVYYKLSYVDRQVENPEQRICEDIPKLCNGMSELTTEIINAVVDAAFYSWMLRRYSKTNKYTASILLYVFGAGGAMTALAPNFGRLFKKQQMLEGSYRQLQARLRTNAESVAFYGGIDKEGGIITDKFREVVGHRLKILGVQWRYGIVQDFLLKYLGATVAVALIIGPFFSGNLRPDDSLEGRAQMLSNMRYHTSVVISLFSALGTLGGSSRKMMKLSAYADRVVELDDKIKAVSGSSSANMASQGRILTSDDEIAFEKAVVITPGNATLVKDLTLRVASGTNLLVTGPNGAGKSSLFRVLGGLWPLADGVIYKPGGSGGDGLSHEIFYVPQRPYVTHGTLKAQIIYPLETASHGHLLTDNQLKDLLRVVDLAYLLDRESDSAQPINWTEVLSLGEQQRLGMARLFYHKPKFAILDECTSGVSMDMEERFCQMVKEMGCTCVTISHRPALVAFHDLVLALDGEGGWSVLPGKRAQGTADGTEKTGDQWAEEFAGAANGASEVGVKARSADASAVTSGMMDSITFHGNVVEEEVYNEKVIATAPPYCPNLHAEVWVPRLALKPEAKTNAQRWQSVIAMLASGSVGTNLQQLGSIALVVLLRTLLQDRIANLNGRSVDLVLRQELMSFIRLIGMSVLQSAASAVLAPSLRHVADMLALTWRRKITRKANSKYLSGNAFYSAVNLAGMTDIDQRLTRDVERLCDDMAALVPTLVKPVVDVCWFTTQLYNLTGKRGLLIAYLYMLSGFTCLRAVTPDFGKLARREHHLEGAFRNSHTHLRTHAESVAFFGGGCKEGATIGAYFDDLVKHLRVIVNKRWSYLVADDFFTKQLPHNVTWTLTLMYALNHGGDFTSTAVQGMLVHEMRYLASVVTQCFTGFGEILALHKRFAELTGGVVRVSELMETVDKASKATLALHNPCLASTLGPHTGNDYIQFEKVQVISPTGATLARDLSFKVRCGESLLVTGPNGSGKTSLFRILGGLWPMPSGTIHKPGRRDECMDSKDIFYVPQRPYTTIGSLRDQVIYPLSLEQALTTIQKASREEASACLTRKLDGLMVLVKLSYLVEREGGWETVTEWGETLSLGEQQRLGMARLFFHCPQFGVLDECTNATSVDVEEQLYRHAAELGITLVTISQRPALVKYHKQQLRLMDGDDYWELSEISTRKCTSSMVTVEEGEAVQ